MLVGLAVVVILGPIGAFVYTDPATAAVLPNNMGATAPSLRPGFAASHELPIAAPRSVATSSDNAQESSGLSPDFATFTFHNLIGYNGNDSIYPTLDTTTYSLPVETGSSFQTSSNASIPVSNSESVWVSPLANETARYGDLGPGFSNYFDVWVWFDSLGASAQYDSPADGCSNPENVYLTDAQNAEVSVVGFPAGDTNEFQVGNNTGRNLTNGNLGGNGNNGQLLVTAELQGLEFLSAFLTRNPELALSLAYGDAGSFIGSSGPTSDNHIQSNPDVNGVSTANQYEYVDGGTYSDSCQGTTNGQNSFSQAVFSQNQMGPSLLAQVTPGQLTVTTQNQLEEAQYVPSRNTYNYYYYLGASSSLSYPVAPASSLGGYVQLFSNTGCSPHCPVVPGATVTVTQLIGPGPMYIEHYDETADSSGYWHFFADADANVDETEYVATWSDPLGTASSSTTQTTSVEGADTESLNPSVNGGQVYGYVTGGGSRVPYATVHLCNAHGCIGTQTNNNGFYQLDFPVPGTSSDPYYMTIASAGWTTTTYSGFTFPVDESTQQNLAFSGSSGGGGGCVAYGTPILTPTGYTPIQNLEEGALVDEYNLSTMSLTIGALEGANTTRVSEIVDVNDGLLYLTPTEQPIYIENNTFVGWLRDPQNLTTADNLFDPVNASWVHVSNVHFVWRHTIVFDVVTSGANNFVANGILLDKKA